MKSSAGSQYIKQYVEGGANLPPPLRLRALRCKVKVGDDAVTYDYCVNKNQPLIIHNSERSRPNAISFYTSHLFVKFLVYILEEILASLL